MTALFVLNISALIAIIKRLMRSILQMNFSMFLIESINSSSVKEFLIFLICFWIESFTFSSFRFVIWKINIPSKEAVNSERAADIFNIVSEKNLLYFGWLWADVLSSHIQFDMTKWSISRKYLNPRILKFLLISASKIDDSSSSFCRFTFLSFSWWICSFETILLMYFSVYLFH